MQQIIKVLIIAIPVFIVGLLGTVGYVAYRIIFYQPDNAAPAPPPPAEPSATPLASWETAKQEAENMKNLLLKTLKDKPRSADLVLEVERTWQSLNMLEKYGTNALQELETKFLERVEKGTRSNEQHEETMRNLNAQLNLGLSYIYGHLWPKALNQMAEQNLLPYDPEAIKKMGGEWKEPAPLKTFQEQIKNYEVWPPKDNLLSRDFGQSSNAGVFSK